MRDAALERITLELDRVKTIRTTASKTPKTSEASKASTARKSASGSGKSSTDEAAHVKAEWALRDHPALGRWLRQQPPGRLVVNRAKVAAEERLDGKYLLTTSDPDLSAEDIALGYKNLLEAERGFRDTPPRVHRHRIGRQRRPPHPAQHRPSRHPSRRPGPRTGYRDGPIPPDLGKRPAKGPREAWTHDPPQPERAFPQVIPRIQAVRVTTNRGTRGHRA